MVNVTRSHRILLLFLTIIMILIVPIPSSSSDWQMYQQNLQHTGFTDEKLYPPLKLEWYFKTENVFISGPVIADGILYINDLDNTLSQLLAGEPIATPVTNPVGCNVKWDGQDAHWMPADACDLI